MSPCALNAKENTVKHAQSVTSTIAIGAQETTSWEMTSSANLARTKKVVKSVRKPAARFVRRATSLRKLMALPVVQNALTCS